MAENGKDFLGISGGLGLGRMELESSRLKNLQNLSNLKGKAAGPNQPAPDKTEKAARQFEALLLQKMLQSMWQTVPSEGMLSGSKEEELYRDMLNEAIATSVSQGKGVGIHDVVAREMAKREKPD